ncbi:hypothetical protein GUITHDRAFT_112216 [Guillardia theta CCMP2712]|uniref:protein-tyrosine-phosphatase n=1 Tax=Guillardia theta (strain CCMP2712) TaxID=905079 RepID=L1IZW3_GUITC|nr:hypothetical protein GUITHDRAFT_112216 [Guillardia theta CCMP2712]EKX41798.1 hypothetical protein GUITHDRAFT_112216 [Guillardia theta CCMP2712]|eukprot:XP_005828778.1 hypothetical protein GUITHDRAFT_112216 [Guillardia theta CCMP2712]
MRISTTHPHDEASKDLPWLAGTIIDLADRISLAAGCSDETSLDPRRQEEMEMSRFLEYFPYGRDFGPVSISAVMRFSEALTARLRSREDKLLEQTVVLTCPHEAEACANAVMLVGAHLILEGRCQDAMPDMSAEARRALRSLPPYRDIAAGSSRFELLIEDVWAGLWRAKELGWISSWDRRGGCELDLEEYEHYDNPYNGGLHQVVPGKLVALKVPWACSSSAGPDTPLSRPHAQAPSDSMGERDWWDEGFVRVVGGRKRERGAGAGDEAQFHPRYVGELLGDMRVRRIIRLSKEPAYRKEALEACGIEVLDLADEDWEAPSPVAVRRLAEAVDGTDGAGAVHCEHGLGKTGTAAAAYMMRTYGMRAREAIGWMRLIRPGSVIGRQQEGLEELEAALRAQTESWEGRGG